MRILICYFLLLFPFICIAQVGFSSSSMFGKSILFNFEHSISSTSLGPFKKNIKYITSKEDIPLDNPIKISSHIFPNPVKDNLNISLSSSLSFDNLSLQILDLQGRILNVHRLEKDNTIISLTRWVKLIDLNFDIIYWSVKYKFVDILNQC
jgi:hypothetical protein